MVPLMVHQLWIPPDGADVPKDIQRNVERWSQLHPGLSHRLWRLEDLEPTLQDVNGLEVLDAVRLCRFPTMQSNIIRLALLYAYGGFWSDLKNLPQRRFLEELLDEELILVEHQPMPVPKPDGYLTNSFMGAVVHHPFIFACLTEAVAGVMRRDTGGSLSTVTGLVMLNRMVKRKEQTGGLPTHRFLRRSEAWVDFMKRTSASYQSGGRHWSLRKSEPLYVDEDGAVDATK